MEAQVRGLLSVPEVLAWVEDRALRRRLRRPQEEVVP